MLLLCRLMFVAIPLDQRGAFKGVFIRDLNAVLKNRPTVFRCFYCVGKSGGYLAIESVLVWGDGRISGVITAAALSCGAGDRDREGVPSKKPLRTCVALFLPWRVCNLPIQPARLPQHASQLPRETREQDREIRNRLDRGQCNYRP
jgi:hypothetical protein